MSYRKLPGVRIRIPVLREMLDVFYPNNDYGMEMILKDWYSRYENLDYIAYRRFICFYAGQGNVASVDRLWKEYRRLYKSKAIADRRAVRALIDVYAVRGDVAKARAVFDEVTVGHGRSPDTMQYNMLLSAHDKAWDLDGAFATFKELCETTTPNNYSFGYLMNMAGSRGNLQLTLSLYRMARGMGITPDVAMVDAIVEAYCQSDRIAAAENLCSIATKRRVLPEEITYSGKVTSPYTIMWNTVLRHYAVRHDLTNVNRVLEHMAELKISYDGKTYEYLLLALVLCKQANHALKLVELAEEKGIFTPSAEHYLLLMSSYLATREPAAVMKISRLMTQKNYPDSAAKMTKLMEAFGQWTQMPRGARLGRPAHAYLEAALRSFRRSLGREERTAKDDIRSVADQYSKMIDILTQTREFATIPEIISLYESQFPEHSTPEEMPLKLLNSLMRADFYEKKFDRVMEAWNVAFDKVMALSKHSPVLSIPAADQENHKVAPAHRYLLNEPLSTVFKVYTTTGDVEGLVAIVTKVLDAGFALSAQNWNHYIQTLARFGRWKDAFLLCEKVLMPQWPGWAQRRKKLRQTVRLPLDIRRLGKSYRYARPNTHTLLMLIRQFMELEQLAPWSSEPAALVDKVIAECPRFVRAAKTMVPTGGDLEMEILGRDNATGGEDEILRYFMKDEDFTQSDDEAELADSRN
jgi:pentatricopeptide repeat-containing protein PET309